MAGSAVVAAGDRLGRLPTDNYAKESMMRALLLVAAATLALSACGRDADEAAEDNALTADNLAVDENLALNGMNADVNALDPATQNMINQDLNTNDPDTNLANGM